VPREIYLVKVGMNMTEGIVEEWYVPDGGTVTKGELLYRLETEKVNLDVDADCSGTVRHVVGEGITMEPGDVVGYIYEAGEAIPDDLPGGGTAGAAAGIRTVQSEPAVRSVGPAPADAVGGLLRVSPIARRLAAERGLELTALTGTGPMGRIVEADVLAAEPAIAVAEPGMVESVSESAGRSSPMARKVARELGIALDAVQGSGPGGRITRADVEAAAETTTVLTELDRENRHLPLRGMRKTIARRMHESLQTMAQLTMDMDVVMDDTVKLRTQLIAEWEEEGIRPTYTDLVIRAVAKALPDHPTMNASLTENELVLHGPINVGMAVALEDGLIVPVVRHADRLDLKSLTRETSKLAAAARNGSLTPDDLQGGTFTVTALGMFGVDSFTPIINSPQAGILGVNRIREEVAWDADKPVRQQRMRLSLTWDHRVLDGAPAAHFLSRVKELLESPYRLLV
jgi:pyruvate dehydrogenase E2 component (dihydrolipoamide acetyltransferase)